MVTGPGDRRPAATGGRGHLRASDADRERVIDGLKAAFAQGQLSKGQFDLRVGQTLASATYGELAALTTDIPTAPIGAPPMRKRAQAHGRVPINKVVKTRAGVIIAAVRRAGSLHLTVDGEEQTRVAGFPIDFSGRQRVLGFPPD